MKKGLEPLKNWSLHTKMFFFSKSVMYLMVCYAFLSPLYSRSQIANYVTNGGFEEHYPCVNPNFINQAKGWRSLDSMPSGVGYFSTCFPNIPQNSAYFQYPFKGQGFGLATFLCEPPCSNYSNRGYFRNRLKGKLIAGKTYCVKLYYNVANNSTYGINSFGAYLGDDNLDTISKGSVRITYLNPQVQNPSSNYATDTLNWKLLTGTFIANGTEKHMVIGNFKSDSNTGKVFQNLPGYVFCDMNIDHVSCIDIDLPAFAGHDTTCIPGTTIYLGRQRDVGIDEACTWYKLPMVITPTTPAIDTAAGIFVSPVITSSYVVRQEICGNVKWDTVVVFKDGVGLEKLEMLKGKFEIFPNPASSFVDIKINAALEDKTKLRIEDITGKEIESKEIAPNTTLTLNTAEYKAGLYFVSINNGKRTLSTQKLLIVK